MFAEIPGIGIFFDMKINSMSHFCSLSYLFAGANLNQSKPVMTQTFLLLSMFFLVKVFIFKIASARQFARPAVYFQIFWSMFNKRRLFIPVSDILFQYYSQAFCQQKP